MRTQRGCRRVCMGSGPRTTPCKTRTRPPHPMFPPISGAFFPGRFSGRFQDSPTRRPCGRFWRSISTWQGRCAGRAFAVSGWTRAAAGRIFSESRWLFAGRDIFSNLSGETSTLSIAHPVFTTAVELALHVMAKIPLLTGFPIVGLCPATWTYLQQERMSKILRICWI